MPLVQTRGAASAQGFGEFAQVTAANYIEEVFSTYLYTGTGATRSISNGIDLSTKGGMVWIKSRSDAVSHDLFDTVRGTGRILQSNLTAAEVYTADTQRTLTSFNTTGFSLGDDSGAWGANSNGYTFASWTFRKQPKFFDIVTYTGNGVSGRSISHNLGSDVGAVIIKKTSATGDWVFWHRSLSTFPQSLLLNTTDAAGVSATYVNGYVDSTTSTTFTVNAGSDSADINASGATYVAYLFAHDAGGFGLTGTDNVISCGSWSGASQTVNLGYEPQFILWKRSDSTGDWRISDIMRGVNAPPGYLGQELKPNTNTAETQNSSMALTSTGFLTDGNTGTYIYIAIRRGPMKVPTDATKVFSPTATAVTTGTTVTTGFVTDLQMANYRSGAASNTVFTDRLRGISNTSAASPTLGSANTNAEITTIDYLYAADNTGWRQGSFSSGGNSIRYDFRRAPSFFDEVCYTGTGVARTVTHNLATVPELMIVKSRSRSPSVWAVYSVGTGNTKYLELQATTAAVVDGIWNNTTPTSTVFSVDNGPSVNDSGSTYVAYLFATCAGVSKVGSYTGTGATQTINCGFGASGSRFVLIKRTDSTGDWYVWDSARGMISGTDPSLLLNSTAAEVNANSVYAISTGFQIVSTAAGINASGGSYIFLSVA
jgi:hypothetical protein